MGNFTNINRRIGAAVGALVISMAFLTAAIGPAASANDVRGDGYAAVQGQAMVQEKQA
jgi:hypothetical protein